MTAKTGVPWALVAVKMRGMVPSLPSDHSIRVEAYRPELAAEMIAVKTTKFMMSAA